MASRFMSGALPGGRNTLDVPVAALAGLSVAFVAFAAPADLLGQAVESSGIAGLIPSAEPPLGMNARLAIGAAGAVIVFALAFLLLRWLDRFGSRPSGQEPEPEWAAPRLRRRDFHPDAAPRPPLSAAAELGEPHAEEIRKVEPEAGVEPEPEAVAAALPSWMAEEPEPATERQDAARPSLPESAPLPRQSHSLPELLDRLEQGLARRRAEPAAPALEAPVPVRETPAAAPQVFPEAADDRLQSAINSLQRLATRND